jgi:acetyl-CoA carboxylase biotin carboxyl carrier protein
MPFEVTAQLTASVVRATVAVGDEVALGQTVLLVESMKMEIPVTAPRAGRVTAVAVGPGDIVAEGDVLVVIAELDRG